MQKPKLKVLIASPRGFCAGVTRAIRIVETALEKWGPPVYVRHEIVHNQHVLRELEKKGAVFVEELEECPDDRPVIFSAHGVSKGVQDEASDRGMLAVDATCPLVTKIHVESHRHHRKGRQIVMIGHHGHPETIGTMGQVPPGEVMLVESLEDIDRLVPRDPENLAYVTQTTLSVDDTEFLIKALKDRFPGIVGPRKQDICYATTNRQAAVRKMIPNIDALIVVGAPNSSNSRRLVEVGQADGCDRCQLIQNVAELDWDVLESAETIGITAGASAPEVLIEELLDEFGEHYELTMEEVIVTRENYKFNIPPILRH